MDGKTVVRTEKAPAPFQGAPYSQAIKANGLRVRRGPTGVRAGQHRGRRAGDQGADRADDREPRGDSDRGRERSRTGS